MMLQILGRRNLVVWLVLMGVTLLSWLLSMYPFSVMDPFSMNTSGQTNTMMMSGIFMVVLAFVKVRLVIFNFMEINHAPRMLRVICDTWIVVAGGGILGLYTGMLGG